MDVQDRLTADVKAVGVFEDDVAIGVQGAQDLRWVLVVDLVPNERGGGRLDKRGDLAESDVEALPVDEGVIGGLDGQVRTLGRERGGALGHRRTDRIGVGLRHAQATGKNYTTDEHGYTRMEATSSAKLTRLADTNSKNSHEENSSS